MATTTPNYGWPVPTSTDLVKDGATAIEDLGDAIDATVFGLGAPGLVLVKTQTIGTTVASVTVSNAFSATYDAYRITISGGVASAADPSLRFNLDGATTNYYYALVFATYTTGAVSGAAASNAGFIDYNGAGSTAHIAMDLSVISPFLAKPTTTIGATQGATVGGTSVGIHKTATSYTGFVLTPSAGTLTGGTIRVYGYVNS